MAATRFFDDGMSYSDKSTFVDYPQIRIRSYENAGEGKFRKIILYTFVVTIISGLMFLFI